LTQNLKGGVIFADMLVEVEGGTQDEGGTCWSGISNVSCCLGDQLETGPKRNDPLGSAQAKLEKM